MKTYDVQFNDENNSNSKGFKMTLNQAIDYVKDNNGTGNSYFDDYKGGEVSVVCNETGDVEYSEIIR